MRERPVASRLGRASQHSAAYAEFLKRCTQEDVHAFVLVRREDGAFVGAANLTQIGDGPLNSAWIAFNAFVPHDGRGYMTDGLRAVLRHAFGTLCLQRVEAQVQIGNARSIALLARVGFRREGSLPRQVNMGECRRDYERWAIHADEPLPSGVPEAPVARRSVEHPCR